MKKTIKTTFTLLLTAIVMTGSAACAKPAEKPEYKPLQIPETTTIRLADEDTSSAEAPETKSDSGYPSGVFKETAVIKLGEHTYYPEDLFERRDRDKHYKDHMLSQLEKADKDLHDDIYVHGTGESEVKGEFRFFGFMMKDGVIWETANMTCWYDEEKGSFWDIDSSFRRAEFSKSGLRPAEDFFGAVYEKASSPEALNKMGEDKVTESSYLLFSDAGGRLFYRFTVNKNSIVEVDAKTGEFTRERYWNGRYT